MINSKRCAYACFLVESITGIQTIKASAIEGKMMKNWEDYLGQYILSSFKLSNLANVVLVFLKLCKAYDSCSYLSWC